MRFYRRRACLDDSTHPMRPGWPGRDGRAICLRIFAVDDAFVDFFEAEPFVERDGRRVLLHRLGFDE